MARSRDISDADLSQMLLRNFRSLEAAYNAGAEIPHPTAAYNTDRATLRSLVADAASGELEERDQPQAGDDPGEFPGKPANPQRGKPAQDSPLRGRTMTIDSALAERLDRGRARRACGLDYGVQYEDDGITVRSRPSGT